MTFRQVMELGASRVPVGLTGEGQWAYETQDGAVLALGENPPPVLMTILQLGEALGPALTRGLQRQGLDSSLAATFPAHADVRLGLTSPTDFWQDLAVEWAEREGSEERFSAELQTLQAHGKTQRIRHRARRLVRNVTLRSGPPA